MATPAINRDVRIMTGTSDDLDAVMVVMESAFGDRFGEAWTRSQLSGILPMTGVELSIAADPASGEVVGFSLTRTVADESELLLIAVREDRHRRGIGRKLLDHFSQSAKVAGLARIHLEVRDGNPAIAMYSAAGFTAIGRRRNYYLGSDGRRFDAITLSCQL